MTTQTQQLEDQIARLSKELQDHESALSGLLIKLASDPSNDDLRRDREKHSAAAARLRGEIADLTRARTHALEVDAVQMQRQKVDRCAALGQQAKKLAQERIKLATQLNDLLEQFVSTKSAYDTLDEECHEVFMRATGPLSGQRDILSRNADLQSGRAQLPQFDEISRLLIAHQHQESPLDRACWCAATLTDAVNRVVNAAEDALEVDA